MNPRSRLATVLLVGSGPAADVVLRECVETLTNFGIDALPVAESENLVSSGLLAERKEQRARAVIVASPDGALPERWAHTSGLPTVRIPVAAEGKTGLDLLRNGDGQLPHGSDEGSFATMAIGAAGARNAALFVVAALALTDPTLRDKWAAFRERQTAAVLDGPPLTLGGEADPP